MKKKVYFSKVIVSGSSNFDSMLRNPMYRQVILLHGKKVEMAHLSVMENYINGLFVTTRTTELEPIHRPGDEDDYSPVDIPDGKGFAYPNTFVYIRELNVLMWEVNRSGLVESGIESYFNDISERNLSSARVQLVPVMNVDAVEKINEMTQINQVDLQIVEPTRLREEHVRESGNFGKIIELANNLNATQKISIKISAVENSSGDKLNKRGVLGLIQRFLPASAYSEANLRDARFKNRLVIHGKHRNENGIIVEELVNVALNRLEDSFSIQRLRVMPHLQIEERKTALQAIAAVRFNQIRDLI